MACFGVGLAVRAFIQNVLFASPCRYGVLLSGQQDVICQRGNRLKF